LRLDICPLLVPDDDIIRYDTIRYDTVEEFNLDSKAECVQLNLAHIARKKYKKKKLKQTKTCAHLVK